MVEVSLGCRYGSLVRNKEAGFIPLPLLRCPKFLLVSVCSCIEVSCVLMPMIELKFRNRVNQYIGVWDLLGCGHIFPMCSQPLALTYSAYLVLAVSPSSSNDRLSHEVQSLPTFFVATIFLNWELLKRFHLPVLCKLGLARPAHSPLPFQPFYKEMTPTDRNLHC